MSTKNYDFENATDGKKGLDLVLTNHYDLILLDMCMPNYSGIDFLLDLKDKKPSEIKKVIVVSSLKTDEYQTQFLSNLGVCSIQQKPIFVQNLLFQVEQELSH